MAWFGGKKSGEGAGDAGEARNPKKARKFFEHAKAVSDARNYDYAIECFINGLRFDPEMMGQHEALREVALRRKAAGNKGPTFKEKLTKSGGKTPLDKMLNQEFLWSKEPLDGALALAVMENAIAAKLEEVAYWAGEIALDLVKKSKSQDKRLFLKIADLFAEIQAFDKGSEAARLALSLDPTNAVLIKRVKDMEAEQTMVRAGYGDEGGFKKSIKNLDKQTALEQEDSIAATADAKDQVISRNRKAYEHEPDNIDNLTKLVRSLLQKEEEDYENEAIALLQKGFKQFDQYRFKMQIGDIRMKQFNRQSRELRSRLKGATDDEKKAEVMEQLKQVAEEQLAFELSEFADRVKNYPTDMGIKFQYGRRQFAAGQYDDSISSFQEAQSDPKHRSQALRYLGEAFAKKDWYEEAIDTFRRGIDAHPHDDDRLAMELRYELMKALHASATVDDDLGSAEEAGKIASTIAQTDINYKDIRQWIDKIRGLIKKLKDGDKNDAA